MNRLQEIENEANQVIIFLAGFNDAKTTISKDAVNFYLNNFSDTLFVRGALRKVVFTSITPEVYSVKTEEM